MYQQMYIERTILLEGPGMCNIAQYLLGIIEDH